MQFLFVAGGLPELAIDYEVAPLQDANASPRATFAARNRAGGSYATPA